MAALKLRVALLATTLSGVAFGQEPKPAPVPPAAPATSTATATAPAAAGAAGQTPPVQPTMTGAVPATPAPADPQDPPKAKTFVFPGVIFQTDYQQFGGPGVGDYQKLGGLGMDNGFRMTRVGVRVGGRVERKFMFHVMAILGRSGADGNQRPANNPTVEDAWVGYEFDPRFRLRMGQFQVPYTLDANEFYPPNADFLEPTLMTRFISAPEIRPLGIMAWGNDPHYLYSLGYINTAGKVTLGGLGDLVGRVAVRPLGSGANFVHIGAGARFGARNPENIWYDAPALQNSTFSYNFWTPTYVTDLANEFHVIPSNQQLTINAELLGAIGRLELAAEGVYANQERREAQRAFLDRTVRTGVFDGFSFYLTAGFWVYGPPRRPASSRGIPYIPPPDPPPGVLEGIAGPTSVQVAARMEKVLMEYNSNARSPEIAVGALDAETRNIKLDAYQAIVNVYMAKHLRFSAEFTTYFVPGSPPRLYTDCSANACVGTLGRGTNQAIAPGAVQSGNLSLGTVDKNYLPPSPGAQLLSQLIIRAQLGF